MQQVPDHIKEDVFAIFEKKNLKSSPDPSRETPYLQFSIELEKLEAYVEDRFSYKIEFGQMISLVMEWMNERHESRRKAGGS